MKDTVLMRGKARLRKSFSTFPLLAFSLFAGAGIAQQQAPTWQEMIADPSQNIYDIKAEFDKQNIKGIPHSGYKQFERWFYWQQFRADAHI